ncbi:MAG: threonine--tRNA ligase [Gemmatimonadetes bacterium]|nr:threonine--tRNA ligase [Gemmatimonadota bacterium]
MNTSIRVTLDGSSAEVPVGTAVREVLERLRPDLAGQALGVRAGEEVLDLQRRLTQDAKLEVVTAADGDPGALYLLRHSAAHVLATAVRELWPNAGIGFGPPIEDGFYYDFDVPRPFTPEDLEAIEAKMREVVEADHPFERREVSRGEARALFADDPYKLERLEEIPEGDVISVYRDGPFLDLCRGPHLPRTGLVQHFKLLSAAGAYWRGDERRLMLQRIYGTAFFSRQSLERYLHRLEEAKRRDHRMLGKQLDLFSIQEDGGPGLIYWHPKGAMLQFLLRRFIEDELLKRGYELVYTPHLASEALFQRSGHLQAYAELMFPGMELEGEVRGYRVKPMNCPMHMLIYASQQRSYRDLPKRYAEVASVYRFERSGTLHGLLRVRSLTMDDAHIFCTPEQIEDEVLGMLDLVDHVMTTFGFEYRLALSTRPAKRIGSEDLWDAAETALRRALERRTLAYALDEGGGAFYGAKIDCKFHDAIGREWQGATIQLDFVLPERFGLAYIGPDNAPHRPAMIHRAIFGTLERFIGGLIEHFAGAFPVWLAPVQVRLLPVKEGHRAAAADLAARLRAAGFRVELDDRNETVSYRVRDGEVLKIPYILVIGEREASAGTVAVRRRGAEEKQIVMPVEAFMVQLRREVAERSRDPVQSLTAPAGRA